MRYFPMFIDTAGQLVVIIGDGHAALCKARLLRKSEARIEVISSAPSPELVEFARDQGICISDANQNIGQARLTFIATECPGADAAWATIAHAQGRLINCVDRQAMCDMLTPALVDRTPLVIAIGTEGTAPVLAQKIRQKLELELHSTIGRLADLAGRLRTRVGSCLPKSSRRAFWRWFFDQPAMSNHGTFSQKEVEERVEEELLKQSQKYPKFTDIKIDCVNLGETNLKGAELIKKLQNAEEIVWQNSNQEHLLDYARRDAKLVREHISNH